MDWKIGQKMVCDRPEQRVTGCTVTTQKLGWVTISCPMAGFSLAGYQEQLEQEGWKTRDGNDAMA